MDDVEDLMFQGSIEQELVDHFLEWGKGTLLHPYNKKYIDSRNPINPTFSFLLTVAPMLAAVATMQKPFPRSKAITWISELVKYTEEEEDQDENGGYEMPFATYGNLVTLGLEYVQLALLAAFGPRNNRCHWKLYNGINALMVNTF
ncbi:hypothetical protein E1B28_003695 [Marasmius oreades]|uniref:Uncharacterized protein n=1 Tax=Marasmius oreades TaxID=181124 RepID=A0A9P7UX01_9AGAR|nr:uncharacterized protein E1B28_003695 [Marasmius oreades]KAG7096246.1 hypothetical protein E1B28_003695 [Marasmius oreades]